MDTSLKERGAVFGVPTTPLLSSTSPRDNNMSAAEGGVETEMAVDGEAAAPTATDVAAANGTTTSDAMTKKTVNRKTAPYKALWDLEGTALDKWVKTVPALHGEYS